MNPRHRRLLIPGLLVVLVVVVVVASVTRRADAAERARSVVVSTITDPAITESSGLAVSTRHPDLAYTINDSGHAPVVYAIRISTGAVVGTTQVSGVTWRDTEAMAIDGRGTIWVADLGDNDAVRRDVALYSFAEPGEGDHTTTATRYPVSYADGPQDVESLAIDPTTGRKIVVSKDLLNGRVLVLPRRLSTTSPNVPRPVERRTLLLATDASWSPDGRWVVVRNYLQAATLDPRTWRTVATTTLPEQPQGETLAFEPGGRSYLVGSEGVDSRLLRVGFSVTSGAAPVPTATATPTSRPGSTSEAKDGVAASTLVLVGGVGAAGIILLGAVLLLVRRAVR